MTPVIRRIVLALSGTALAIAAAGSAPALAATNHNSPSTPSRLGHIARTSTEPLYQGQELTPGASLGSGCATLVMQHDGNLVLYLNGAVGDYQGALWSSRTRGDNTAVLQKDGDFVIYPSNQVGNARAAEWATHTLGNNMLEVQDDCDMVIYPSGDAGDPGSAEWSTETGHVPMPWF